MSQILQITKGTDRLFNLSLLDPASQPITTLTTGDILSAEVWLGQDRQVLFTPTASWVSASLGTYSLSFSAADTAALEAGRYFLTVKLLKTDDRTVKALEAQIELEAAPGSATGLSTYATLKDALPYAPWLRSAITDTDLGDMSNHFHLARKWLEGIIQAKARYGSYYNNASMGRWNTWWPQQQSGENKYLQDLLDADKLLVRAKVVEITAKRAIGTICQSMIAPTKGESNYQMLASQYLREADALVQTYTAEIDTNSDGICDWPINCGLTSIR